MDFKEIKVIFIQKTCSEMYMLTTEDREPVTCN